MDKFSDTPLVRGSVGWMHGEEKFRSFLEFSNRRGANRHYRDGERGDLMAIGRVVDPRPREFRGDPDLLRLTDDRLLEQFIERGDEAAFEALVVRHAPRVLGVCRQV